MLSEKRGNDSHDNDLNVNTIYFHKGDQSESYEAVRCFSSKFDLETKGCDGWLKIKELSPRLIKLRKKATDQNDNGENFALSWKEMIGSGGYGEAWRVELKQGKLIKTYVGKHSLKKNGLLELRNELECLEQISSTRIVDLIGYIELKNSKMLSQMILILEYCNGGNLKEMIEDTKKIYSMFTVVYWSEQLFSALNHLREHNIIHQDIKPGNILLISPNASQETNGILYDVKLCDFGSAMRSEYTTTLPIKPREAVKGTPRYMSPEAYEFKMCHRSDIYCLGLVLWEMIERRLCYSIPSELESFKTAKQLEPPLAHCPTDIQNLVFQCTKTSYRHRATDAETIRKRFEEIFLDYKHGRRRGQQGEPLHLRLEVEIDEIDEKKRIRPIGFDGTNERRENLFDSETSDWEWSNLPEPWSPIDKLTGHAPSEFHRKRFKENFKRVHLNNFDAKAFLSEESEKTSYRFNEIEKDYNNIAKDEGLVGSTTIEAAFQRILLVDFSHQAELFHSIIEMLSESARIVTPAESYASRTLSPSNHLNYACWDLFENLKQKWNELKNFPETSYSLAYQFQVYDFSEEKLVLLRKDLNGGLFLDDREEIRYLNGAWENARFCIDEQEIDPNGTSPLSCTDLNQLVQQEFIKLNKISELYHASLLKNDRFQIPQYVFQFRRPPNHSSTCIKEEPLRAPNIGFPKEVEWDRRIGTCKCTQSCEKSKSFIEVYTKICKLLLLVKRRGVEVLRGDDSQRKRKIDFDGIAEVKHKKWKFYFHGNEKVTIWLDHPKNYGSDESEIHSISRGYRIKTERVSINKFPDNYIKIGIHEIFNLNNQKVRKSKFFLEQLL